VKKGVIAKMKGFTARGGLIHQFSNRGKININRKMGVTCPICYVVFYRPPSHIERVKTYPPCCSRACSAESRKIKVLFNCVSCGNEMELAPSEIGRKTTCSKQCSTLRRVKDKNNVKKTSLGYYQKTIKEIARCSVCKECGVTSAIWIVKNCEAKLLDSGEVNVDISEAELVCRGCHLSGIAIIGGEANKKRLSQFKAEKALLKKIAEIDK